VAASDASYVWPADGLLELGSVKLHILPPPGWRRDTNNESIGVIVEHGAFSALLTGDAEVDELNYFLDQGVPRVTVLKASHHGSRSGVSPRWVDVTRPRVVVISCGADNAYGHPDPWALRYYGAVADTIYRTDLDGHVAITGKRDGSFEVATQAALAAR
jgi:beta-lactamase superfamily II metal-dependent hydrolase